MNTPRHLLALHVTPVDEQERGQVARLAQAVQGAGETVEVAYAARGRRLLAVAPGTAFCWTSSSSPRL